MSMIRILDYATKIGGALALILGLAFWNGALYSLVHVHAAIGIIVVLSLWALAILAFTKNMTPGLVLTATVWGLATIGIGIGQTHILMGDLHWLVQILHLALGLGAIALSAILARKAVGRTTP